jgi:uncharacterized membrane protein
MNFVYAFRIHVAMLAVFALLVAIAHLFGPEEAVSAAKASRWGSLISAAMWVWLLSWLWMLIQSWVMLVRSWKTRTSGENAKLFMALFLFIFSPPIISIGDASKSIRNSYEKKPNQPAQPTPGS